MTRFEFIDEPYGVYFIGGINGCWVGFKKFIGCVFGGHKQNDYMTLFEKKMFDRIYKGNGSLRLPGPAMTVAKHIENDTSRTSSLIISTGSAQLGRYEPGYYDKVLRDLNGFLEEQRIKLLLVRGGDDDPSYYDGRVGYSNIKAIPDYSLVTVNAAYSNDHDVKFCNEQRQILCIGGGESPRHAAHEMLYRLAKRSGKSLGGNVVFNGSGFHLSLWEIAEAEKEQVDTLVTFSDEINNCKCYDRRILRNLLVWYTSGDRKPSKLLFEEKTPFASRPKTRQLSDYTSIYRLQVKSGAGYATDTLAHLLNSSIQSRLQEQLAAYADIRADIFDVPQM